MSSHQDLSSPLITEMLQRQKQKKAIWKINLPDQEALRERVLLGEPQPYYSRTNSGLLTPAKLKQLSAVNIKPTSAYYHKGLVTVATKTIGLNFNLTKIDSFIKLSKVEDIEELAQEIEILQQLVLTSNKFSTSELLKERNKRLNQIAVHCLHPKVLKEMASTKTFMKNTGPKIGLYKVSLNESQRLQIDSRLKNSVISTITSSSD